jgi:hypothetical protein
MSFLYPWIALTVVLLGLIALGLVVMAQYRNRPGAIVLSAEERAELTRLPKTATQKIALWGFAVCSLVGMALVAFFLSKGGALVYWEDDGMRMQILGLFLTILLSYAGLSALAAARGDERDRNILRWAPLMQANAALITLAAWMVYLGQSFHDGGSVPMVYMYLIFGSVMIVHAITHFAGILLGYWASHRYA